MYTQLAWALALCLVTVADWSPDFCPDSCVCHRVYVHILTEHLNAVDCHGQLKDLTIERIPEGSQALILSGNRFSLDQLQANNISSVQYIDLSSNQIKFHSLSKLARFLQPFASLRALDLSNNHLGSIDSTLFNASIKLTYLNIDSNGIVFVAEGAFQSLQNINTLSLANNNLQLLDPDWFSNISTTLRKLQLKNNTIRAVVEGDLRHLTMIRELDLSDNQMALFDDFLFGSEEVENHLEELDLSNNFLKQIPTSSLRKLNKLRILSLNNNTMTRIGSDSFLNMTNVRKLSLNDMPNLLLVDEDALYNLPELRQLELSQNPKLRYIHHRAFVGCQNLIELFVHECNLEGLDERILPTVPALGYMSFYGNPINCNCFSRWLRDTNITNIDRNRIVCAEPEIVKQATLQQISDQQLSSDCIPSVVMFNDGPTVSVQFGSSLNLDCRSIGGHTIQWKIGNILLSNDTSGHLIRESIQHDDMGNYHCLVKSQTGAENSESVFVTVDHSLVMLTNVAVSNVLVMLSWNSTTGSTEISYAAKDGESHSIPLPEGIHSYTIRSLQPETHYTFCLLYHEKKEQTCLGIQTKPALRPEIKQMLSSGQNPSNLTISTDILMGIAVIVGVVLVIIVSVLVYRRYQSHRFKRQKNYQRQHDESLTEPFTYTRRNQCYQPTTAPLWVDEELT